jgi:hypothetical protein
MRLPAIPLPDRLWTSFRPDDAELLAADSDAGRVGGETPLVVRLWRSEVLCVRLARDEIRLTPAIVQWRHDGAYALPLANTSASLTPSGMLPTRAADLAEPAAALAHLMAALAEALGPAARRRTDAVTALARLRLAEADLSSAILRIGPGGRLRLDAPSGRRIPLARGRHAGAALKALWTPSDRIPCIESASPTSPTPPFAPSVNRPIARPESGSAHARIALHDAARLAVEAAGIPPHHLGL